MSNTVLSPVLLLNKYQRTKQKIQSEKLHRQVIYLNTDATLKSYSILRQQPVYNLKISF